MTELYMYVICMDFILYVHCLNILFMYFYCIICSVQFSSSWAVLGVALETKRIIRKHLKSETTDNYSFVSHL